MPATNFQAGILDAPPEHILVAALAFVPTDVPSCQSAFQNLRELVHRELAADINEIDRTAIRPLRRRIPASSASTPATTPGV